MQILPQILMQIRSEATGEFDPLGTLFVVVLIVAFVYIARWTLKRSGGSSGARRWGWIIATLVFGGIAFLLIISIALNLLAALGLL